MSRKATKSDVENALLQLSKYVSESLALEFWGKRARVIRRDNSRPFGSNYYSYDELYHIIWFAIDAMRIAGVKRLQD